MCTTYAREFRVNTAVMGGLFQKAPEGVIHKS